MASIHRTLLAAALLLAALLAAAGCGSSSPSDTVEGFFRALAAEDLGQARTFLTGKALATHPAQGSQASRLAFAMGKAYQGLDDLKTEDDQAVGVVKLDGKLIAQTLLAASKSVLEGVRDPEVRQELKAQMSKGLTKIAQAYSRVPIRLARQKEGWKISDLR